MELVFEEFKSLEEYLNVIKQRKPNSAFEGHSLSSQDGDYEFTMTASYEEAEDLARKGYKEGLDKMSVFNIYPKYVEKINKNMPSVDVVGYAPHVANAIAGIPNSMITHKAIKQENKVLTILYCFSSGVSTDSENFVIAGKNLLNVIVTLEVKGYRVGLYVLRCSSTNSTVAGNIVCIKDWKQPSNPLKMAYPLIHPSYFRRNGFRWTETCPEITDDEFAYNGYGRPFQNTMGGKEGRIEFLKEKGILKDNWFYVEFKDAYRNNAEELIKLMGIK